MCVGYAGVPGVCVGAVEGCGDMGLWWWGGSVHRDCGKVWVCIGGMVGGRKSSPHVLSCLQGWDLYSTAQHKASLVQPGLAQGGSGCNARTHTAQHRGDGQSQAGSMLHHVGPGLAAIWAGPGLAASLVAPYREAHTASRTGWVGLAPHFPSLPTYPQHTPIASHSPQIHSHPPHHISTPSTAPIHNSTPSP